MKKSRPALTVSVLCEPAHSEACLDIFFRELTTLGVRMQTVERASIEREFVEVETKFGRITVKVGKIGADVVNIKPEFEVCKRIAIENNAPLKIVVEEAKNAYINRR